MASLAYIGDKVAVKVASRLEGETLGSLDIISVNIQAISSASIINYPSWLSAVSQSIEASPVKMIILSLGVNDMRMNAYDFPDDATLDVAVSNILDKLSGSASVYWVLPHETAAYKEPHHPEQRNRIISAIIRAKASGNYPKLFVVDVDAWASNYQLTMLDLLARNKTYLSNRGADIATQHVLAFGELVTVYQ